MMGRVRRRAKLSGPRLGFATFLTLGRRNSGEDKVARRMGLASGLWPVQDMGALCAQSRGGAVLSPKIIGIAQAQARGALGD
jgi:hypothetical protein